MKSATVKPAPPLHPAAARSDMAVRALHLLLLALVALAAYSNSFHTPFYFDDISSIVENEVIKDLGRFLSGEGYRFNPRRVVGYFSFALNYRAGGLDPFGYHVANLVIHLLCGWLVYFFVGLTLKTPFFAGSGLKDKFSLVPLCAALLFVAHPVQTQAVIYLVQRLASLVTLFYLLSLVCYLKGRLALGGVKRAGAPATAGLMRPALYFLGSLLAAALALRTKEIAATLPLVLLLCEFSFFPPSRKRNLLLAGSLLLFALAAAAAVMTAGKPLGELLTDVNDLSRETTAISRGEYLLTQFSVIATYLRLLFLPVNQNLDYHYPVFSSLFEPRVFLSLLLHLSLLAGAVWLHLRSAASGFRGGPPSQGELGAAPGARLIAFGIFWFFITLSVESSVIPISDVIFEHRLYLPSVGAFIAAVSTAVLLLRRVSVRVFATSVAVVTVAFGIATWQRNKVWDSEVTLWGDVVRKSPGKSRANNHYGVALKRAGRIPEADEHLRIALRINPLNPDALYNLGRVRDEAGDVEGAIGCYEAAVTLDPNLVFAQNNLAVDYLLIGKEDLAIERYNTLLQKKPDFAEAHNNLGFILMQKGRVREAIRHYQAAIQGEPDYAKAHHNLAMAYQETGESELAIKHFRECVRVKPDDPAAQANLVRALTPGQTGK